MFARATTSPSGGRSGASRRHSALATVACLLLTFSPWAVHAATLGVHAGAARTGAFGMEITPDATCSGPASQTLASQTVHGTASFSACQTLVTGSSFVVSSTGDATLTAGETVVLADGFRVDSGGSLAVGIEPSLISRGYVQDDTPSAESTYNAEFYLNLDDLSLVAGEQFQNFVAYSFSGKQLELLVEPGPQVRLRVRRADGGFSETSAVSLAAGWNQVVIEWSAAANASAALTVNDGTPRTLSSLDTSGGRIDFVRWGLVAGAFSSAPGSFAQDDFSSWR